MFVNTKYQAGRNIDGFINNAAEVIGVNHGLARHFRENFWFSGHTPLSSVLREFRAFILPYRLDAITTENSAFKSFDSLLNAAGNYRPSIDLRVKNMLLLADEYDKAQYARNDTRRAYRYGGAK